MGHRKRKRALNGECERERLVSPYFDKKGSNRVSCRADGDGGTKACSADKFVEILSRFAFAGCTNKQEKGANHHERRVSPFFQPKIKRGAFEGESGNQKGGCERECDADFQAKIRRDDFDGETGGQKGGCGRECDADFQSKIRKDDFDGESGEHEGGCERERECNAEGEMRERERKVSPYFQKGRSRRSWVLSAAEKRRDAYRRKSPLNTWKPPCSPYHLLQEDHAHDPWRVLVICMLLNVTTGTQTKKYLDTLFEYYPDAKSAAGASIEILESIIDKLGLKSKRARMIKRMSCEYLDDGWTHVTQLHGVGKYAADAYAIFCTGKWKEVNPKDHKLKDYWGYLWRIQDRLT